MFIFSGIVGLLWASLFHFHGYRDVIISEVVEHRKLMASRLDLGFPAVKPSEINKEMKEAQEAGDETWGFDLIVDCTGLYYLLLYSNIQCFVYN